MSFVILNVGHEGVHAIIPTAHIVLEELAEPLTAVIRRLSFIVKGRNDRFNMSVLGNKIDLSKATTASAYTVTDVFSRAIMQAEFLKHDHVEVALVSDLMLAVEHHETLTVDAYERVARACVNTTLPSGIRTAFEREMQRIKRIKEAVAFGVTDPIAFG